MGGCGLGLFIFILFFKAASGAPRSLRSDALLGVIFLNVSIESRETTGSPQSADGKMEARGRGECLRPDHRPPRYPGSPAGAGIKGILWA